MKRRTFLALVALAKHAAALWSRPFNSAMFVGEGPGGLAVGGSSVRVVIHQRKLMARIRYTKEFLDHAAGPLDPPACLAFPGGTFRRALEEEREALLHDMRRSEERLIRWMDRPRKGPRGRVRRSPGNLPKRLRKQERRRRWHR